MLLDDTDVRQALENAEAADATMAISVTEAAKITSTKDQTQPVNSGSCIED